MAVQDLLFIASFFFAVALVVRILALAALRRWDRMRRAARLLGGFVASYAAILIAASLAMPRRVYSPGERRCFDDWCVTAMDLTAAADASLPEACRGGAGWVASVEVSSVAKRVWQRAPDAQAEVEDDRGARYQPCGALRGSREMTERLGPGESFRVALPFRLPRNVEPAGLVFHHGQGFPGVAILAEDQSWLHPPALHRVSVQSAR